MREHKSYKSTRTEIIISRWKLIQVNDNLEIIAAYPPHTSIIVYSSSDEFHEFSQKLQTPSYDIFILRFVCRNVSSKGADDHIWTSDDDVEAIFDW